MRRETDEESDGERRGGKGIEEDGERRKMQRYEERWGEMIR